MPASDSNLFFIELEKRCETIKDYILDERFVERFQPDVIKWAVTAYVRYGGKRLRPAILLFSCGAVGGDESRAVPAAAAVEIFHTWTLVHDDIIDRDAMRRGKPTIHEFYRRAGSDGRAELKLTPEEARHYGISVAILTGDIQHGWGISMMTELTTRCGVDPFITLSLIDELDTRVLNTLVEGEVLDIQFAHRALESLTPAMIEDMLWRKTGALYEFCGRAGALIGTGDRNHPGVRAVARFAALCGTAFQLQDDILGVVGKVDSLGKPIGSDLREGKRTLVIYYAYQNASSSERRWILEVLGNHDADDGEVGEIIELIRDLGGIEQVSNRARELIEEAGTHLEALPDSPYKELLREWADFMIEREF